MKLAVLLASIFFCRPRSDSALGLEGGEEKDRRVPEKPSFQRTQTNDTIDLYDEDGSLDTPISRDNTGLERVPPRRTGLYRQCKDKLVALKNFLLQAGNDDAENEPIYRLLPIISGIVVPFSILLEIPGLTSHWYIITEDNQVVVSKKNSPLLDTGLGISMACALIANIAIIMRFLEKKVRTSTLVAIAALCIHDVINIVAVTVFGVVHRFNDGFTFGQSFWFTVCATIASVVTSITLIVDYVRTPHFARASSGLTRKQRSLVIVVMLLFIWIAFGGLINSILNGLDFVDGLYFTVVVIETIGFGDLVPRSTGGRIFTIFHSIFGILLLALTISICRDTVIEFFEDSYRKRILAFADRHKAHSEKRRQRLARREAFKRQLKKSGLPVFVHREGSVGFRHLNIDGLTSEQRREAENEAEDILNSPEITKLERRSTLTSQTWMDEELSGLQKEFVIKLTVVWTLFLTFWLIGSAIFMATEDWSYGGALWFCFESFSTIGFGDRTPATPAGRSIFIVWALLGVGTMTILISVLGEAFSSRYERVMQARVAHIAEKGKEEMEKAVPERMKPNSATAEESNEGGDGDTDSSRSRTLRRSSSCPQLQRRLRRPESGSRSPMTSSDSPSSSERILNVDFANVDKSN